MTSSFTINLYSLFLSWAFALFWPCCSSISYFSHASILSGDLTLSSLCIKTWHKHEEHAPTIKHC